MLPAAWKPNDKKARNVIYLFSGIVFSAILFLSQVHLKVKLGFNVHIFALANAIINSIVAILLLLALAAVKGNKYLLHKKLMLAALALSVLFLVSYICHHLLAGETRFGDLDHNGILSPGEEKAAGTMRYVYYILLGTHIPLAAIVLPFILFSAYRALTGNYEKHKKLVRITWPLWFYVAVTGVVVYWMISPYYT